MKDKYDNYKNQVEGIRNQYGENSYEYEKILTNISEINKSLRDIKKMRHDKKYEYRFRMGDDNTTDAQLGNNGHPIVTMQYSNNETRSHEFRHGGQFARRQLRIDSKGNVLNYGIRKEIDAYRAQMAYNGALNLPIKAKDSTESTSEYIYQFSSINKSLIESIYDTKNGTFVYPQTSTPKKRNTQ